MAERVVLNEFSSKWKQDIHHPSPVLQSNPLRYQMSNLLKAF